MKIKIKISTVGMFLAGIICFATNMVLAKSGSPEIRDNGWPGFLIEPSFFVFLLILIGLVVTIAVLAHAISKVPYRQDSDSNTQTKN